MTQPYDVVADDYIAMFGDVVADPATSAAIELLGDVEGLRLLDAPCGNGRVARELIRRGAREVVALDVSTVMLDRARVTGDSTNIDYQVGDLTADGVLDGQQFDAIICNYGLNEIDDLEAALGSLRRLVVPDGTLTASILHPCFPGVPGVAPGSFPPEGYHQEGRWATQTADVRAELGTLHRTISTYLNTALGSGFTVEALVEPPLPGLDGVPFALAVRLRRS